MMRPVKIVAALVASAVLASAGLCATDPVKENLRRLKAKLKAAHARNAPKPAPPKPAAPVYRPLRVYRPPVYRPPVPRSSIPGMPVLKHKVDYTTERLGTLPNTGDIVVETTNKGQTVFVYWQVALISGSDGKGLKKDLAPAKYPIMLKGPKLRRAWKKFVQVKPDMVAVLKVELPDDD